MERSFVPFRRRAAALILTRTPSWMLAAALMAMARSGENFGVVHRLVDMWRQSHADKRLVAASEPERSTEDV